MGQAGSSLVDCVYDGDIQSLKTSLQQRKQQQHQSTVNDVLSGNNSTDEDQQWLLEVEDAMHAVVGMEIHSAQQFQQLQIALEMLLQAKPEAWASCAGNSANWTGAHRACVTGNLSFLTFVFQHYDAFDVQERDAFGLFPIDLVPPELLRTPEEMALDAAQEPRVGGKEPIFPATARSRRNLALQILRQKKNEAQARCIDQFLFHEHPSQGSAVVAPADKKSGAEAKTSKEEELKSKDAGDGAPSVDNQQEHHEAEARIGVDMAANGRYYIAFESSRDHLVDSNATTTSAANMGEVHERSTPLRLKYRFPRIDEFLNGYFQLIWREGVGQPRSEEPNYGTHVLMRDEMFLDPQFTEFVGEDNNALSLQEGRRKSPSRVLVVGNTSEPHKSSTTTTSHRRLEDQNPVLQGCFPFDVSRIPHDAVCHVLFVASDKHLMKRTVVLSTEGIALRDANDDYDFLASRNYEEDEEDDEEDDEDDEEDEDATNNGFVFHVAGEAFAHPNPAFSDKTFEGIEDFEQFVKALRSSSDRQLQRNQTGETSPARLLVSKNEGEEDEESPSGTVKSVEADKVCEPTAPTEASVQNDEVRAPEATEIKGEEAGSQAVKPTEAPAVPQEQLQQCGNDANDKEERDNQKEHEAQEGAAEEKELGGEQ